MGRKKSDSNAFTGAFKVFFNSLNLYLRNFENFLKYMSFPVLGQVIGLVLIFTVNYFFILNIPQLAKLNPLFENITFVFTVLIICLLPGFLIFTKALFDYFLAFASLNLVANHLLSSGKLKDFEIQDDIVKQRLASYIFLLFILGFMYFVLSFPLLWIVLIFAIALFSLTIQAFILEDKSPFESLTMSFLFVKYNFLKTSLALLLVGFLTYFVLGELFFWLLQKADIAMYLSNPVELYINLLPINDINEILVTIPYVNLQLQANEISMGIIKYFVYFIIIGYTLPIRSIVCTDLFKQFYGYNVTEDKETKKLLKKAK